MSFSLPLYSLLKNMVGKDVTKIAMPVHLNEPLSFTQVLLAIIFNSVALSIIIVVEQMLFVLLLSLVNMSCLDIVLYIGKKTTPPHTLTSAHTHAHKNLLQRVRTLLSQSCFS